MPHPPTLLIVLALCGCTATAGEQTPASAGEPAASAPVEVAVTPPSSGEPRSDDNLRDRCDPVPRQATGRHAEKVNYGRYFVTNQTKEPIRVQAGGVTLTTSEIAPGTTAAIFNAAEGSGGHVRPSNFFGSFSVEGSHGAVYSGVNDGDWVDRGGHCGHARYELVVR